MKRRRSSKPLTSEAALKLLDSYEDDIDAVYGKVYAFVIRELDRESTTIAELSTCLDIFIKASEMSRESCARMLETALR